MARIPPTVSETQFRTYFEAYGKLQDAYMPKDHSKQGFRGIGFVTFASPDSVEKASKRGCGSVLFGAGDSICCAGWLVVAGVTESCCPVWLLQVMAVKHFMNGHEIAIDRATPKEEPSALKSVFTRLPLPGTTQRRSFDNGEQAWPSSSSTVHTCGGPADPPVPCFLQVPASSGRV